MRWIICILFVAVLGSACSKNNDNNTPGDFSGAYVGTFSRTGMDTANVRLNIGNGIFSGQSDRVKYPAICHGSYSQGDNTITFVDSCTWTADFDWSLILNGTYNISYPDNTLIRIWRTSGAITDEYLLRKLTR